MLRLIFLAPHCFFFFNDTATTEIYTLSLHDALPISIAPSMARTVPGWALRRLWSVHRGRGGVMEGRSKGRSACRAEPMLDRKSTRLNSSHSQISYAVFCLKKKKKDIK